MNIKYFLLLLFIYTLTIGYLPDSNCQNIRGRRLAARMTASSSRRATASSDLDEYQYKQIKNSQLPTIERHYLIIRYHSVTCSFAKYADCYNSESGAPMVGFDTFKRLLENDAHLMRVCNGHVLPHPMDPFNQSQRKEESSNETQSGNSQKPIVFSRSSSLTAIATVDGLATIELLPLIRTDRVPGPKLCYDSLDVLDDILLLGGTDVTLRYSSNYAAGSLNKLGLNRPKLAELIAQLDKYLKVNIHSRELFTRLRERIIDEVRAKVNNRLAPKLESGQYVSASDEINYSDMQTILGFGNDNAFDSHAKDLFLRRCVNDNLTSTLILEFDYRKWQKFDHLIDGGRTSCKFPTRDETGTMIGSNYGVNKDGNLDPDSDKIPGDKERQQVQDPPLERLLRYINDAAANQAINF